MAIGSHGSTFDHTSAVVLIACMQPDNTQTRQRKAAPETRAHRRPSRSSIVVMAAFSSFGLVQRPLLSASTLQLPLAAPTTMCDPDCTRAQPHQQASSGMLSWTCVGGSVFELLSSCRRLLSYPDCLHAGKSALCTKLKVLRAKQTKRKVASWAASNAQHRGRACVLERHVSGSLATCAVRHGAPCLKWRSHTSRAPSCRAVKKTPGRALLHAPAARHRRVLIIC